MEPAVRVELTTNGLQIRCSATELRWLKRNGELCEYCLWSQSSGSNISTSIPDGGIHYDDEASELPDLRCEGNGLREIPLFVKVKIE